MGMHSEAAAGATARQMASVLREALKTGNPVIIEFCRQHIVPIFDDSVSEAFGSYDGDQSAREEFGRCCGDLSQITLPKSTPG